MPHPTPAQLTLPTPRPVRTVRRPAHRLSRSCRGRARRLTTGAVALALFATTAVAAAGPWTQRLAAAVDHRGPGEGGQGGGQAQAIARTQTPIDRRALVSRHDVHVRRFDPESPLSVGNGEFAFSVDATGLQTFADAFESTTPLGTLSQWGWHTAPNPQGWSMETFRHNEFDSYGRAVGYADIPGNTTTPEIAWLRANPHRLHLGRIGLRLTMADGTRARPDDLSEVDQVLDLWNGVIVSRFAFDGQEVRVRTVSHPTRDAVAVQVTSPLVSKGRVQIEIEFPYGTGDVATADWKRPEAHQTTYSAGDAGTGRFTRTLDGDGYFVDAAWQPVSTTMSAEARHRFALSAAGSETLELSAAFSPKSESAGRTAGSLSFPEAQRAASEHWQRFWQTGGAIDLSSSRDPRWRELERRIVLSRYLTAIQCAGSLPPQETGLTYNSWEGKFHLEMHWWHAVHFAAWDRIDLLEKSLGYYERILPKARATAKRQGYAGARWPKMTGPTGEESPSSVGPFLVWQQPHPIYYAELAYRAHGDRATLDRFARVVDETATFMASFPVWDPSRSQYVLGPPLQCAQERFPKDSTTGCTFELAYWRWGLETAQAWRVRRGLARDERWDRVICDLESPVVVAGKYVFANSRPDSYDDPKWKTDHPTVLAMLGFLPGDGLDRPTMKHTFDWVWTQWTWPDTWGWDYPMVAMTAARLGEPARAVDALLLDTPKNHYGLNGHNYQRPGLSIYLPGNGGLLAAVAMMAAGWDGGPDRPAPGFPDDGSWTVRYEGLRRLP